jgi:Na+/melibiose symporter-like transporter
MNKILGTTSLILSIIALTFIVGINANAYLNFFNDLDVGSPEPNHELILLAPQCKEISILLASSSFILGLLSFIKKNKIGIIAMSIALITIVITYQFSKWSIILIF